MFRSVELTNFSSAYYYATRVVYSALCRAGLSARLRRSHPCRRNQTAELWRFQSSEVYTCAGVKHDVDAYMIERDELDEERERNIAGLRSDAALQLLSRNWIEASAKHKYSYNFTWLGRPVIQYPQDLIAIREIIWRTRPELIVETGIAHGGSLIFSASILELIGGGGQVVGVDVDIRSHNRKAIEGHPLFARIDMIEGSSIDPKIIGKVARAAAGKRTMIMLDSNHTHDHVLAELRAYAPLVSAGCYLVVLDTIIEDLPHALFANRPWKRGNNPKTAVHEFLRETARFRCRQVHGRQAFDHGSARRLSLLRAQAIIPVSGPSITEKEVEYVAKGRYAVHGTAKPMRSMSNSKRLLLTIAAVVTPLPCRPAPQPCISHCSRMTLAQATR